MTRRWMTAGVAVLLLLAGCSDGDDLQVAPQAKPGELAKVQDKLEQAVKVDNVREHLVELQALADTNGGNRFAGLPGYDASADYVAGLLREAGYDVRIQEFEYTAFEVVSSSFLQTATTARTFEEASGTAGDYDVATYSGSGSLTDAEVVPVDTAGATSGCEAGDFTAAVTGKVALVKRGTCPFGVKAQNAQAAGAVGVLIYNDGTAPDRTGVIFPTLGAPGFTIPVLGISFALGGELSAAGTRVSLAVEALSEVLTTRNVIAESRRGDPENVVMAGAHLDSVLEGPGINDNGSGSAAVLETALQLAKQLKVNDTKVAAVCHKGKTLEISTSAVSQHLRHGDTEGPCDGDVAFRNRVRFGFWSAEESGLVGSTYYVNALSAEEKGDLALYLNFDMVGSPNFIRGIYDGDESDFDAPVAVPDGSAEIEGVFEAFYAKRGLTSQGTEFSGRSDYQAFINNDIPAGGLFTGAEGIKTQEEQARYGGTAGVAYDPCYHQACDTLGNVDLTVLDQNSDAVANAVVTFAVSEVGSVLGATSLGVTAQSQQGGLEHLGHELQR